MLDIEAREVMVDLAPEALQHVNVPVTPGIELGQNWSS